MKKLSMLTIIVLLTLSLLTCCGNPNANTTLENVKLPPMGNNDMAVVIQISDSNYHTYSVDVTNLDNGTVLDALNSLVQHNQLHLTTTDGGYGAYITAIATLMPQNNQFISLYTSVAKDHDTSAYAKTYNCGGVEVVTSGLGVSSMSAVAGCVVYIQMETF